MSRIIPTNHSIRVHEYPCSFSDPDSYVQHAHCYCVTVSAKEFYIANQEAITPEDMDKILKLEPVTAPRMWLELDPEKYTFIVGGGAAEIFYLEKIIN